MEELLCHAKWLGFQAARQKRAGWMYFSPVAFDYFNVVIGYSANNQQKLYS